MTTEQQAARSPLTAKLTTWVNRPELRIRFSTVLLILALINFPFLMGLIPMRWLQHAAPQIQSLSTFYFYDVTGIALAICVLCGVVTFPIYLAYRKWAAAWQSFAEVSACLILFLVLPSFV